MASYGVAVGHAAPTTSRSRGRRGMIVRARRNEVDRLHEALGQLSRSARGLAWQHDDARAELSRAKGTPRLTVPVRTLQPKSVMFRSYQALREVRDRQLGNRHCHDLIVNLSLVGHSRHLRGRGGSDDSSSNGVGGGKRPDSRGSSLRASPGRSPSPTAATGQRGQPERSEQTVASKALLPKHPGDRVFALTISEATFNVSTSYQ